VTVKTQPSASPPHDGEKDREMEGYEQDFYAWTQRTAELLRAGRFDEADIEHVAEEIEDMGWRDVRELNSRMRVLLAHLLKWQFQPDQRSASWRGTISAQRQELDSVLEQSPSLRPKLETGLADNYTRAVKRAAAETGLGSERFPATCPYAVEQVLDEDFLP
jgi:Domain of unknown function DUF29